MSLDIGEKKQTPKTDLEIILLYKEGNAGAFKELVDRYTPILYNFIARIASRNEAPDIVQEIFIKIWKYINKFDPTKASFKTWIFTIAKNTATDFLRKKKSLLFSDIEKYNEDETSFEENIPDDKILRNEELEKIEDIELLNSVLEKLRPTYREILILHYQEDMTFNEIGKTLNKPLNTIKSQHRRALLELQSYLK